MNGKNTLACCVILGFVLLPAHCLYGLISGSFTPVDLTKQSDTIVELVFDGAITDGKTDATVVRVLKGTVDKKKLAMDFLGGTLKKEQAEGVLKSLKSAGAVPAI
jgi:hypothetical protein